MRITLVATVALALGLSFGALLLLHSLRSALLDSQAGTGERRAAELAALAGREPLPEVLPALDTGRTTLLQVVDSNGQVVAASAQLAGLRALLDPAHRHRELRDEIAHLGDGPWLLEPTPATLGGSPDVVIVVTSLADYERSAELLEDSLIVSLPILILLVGAVVWVVVGRALRPVEEMRAEVQEITSERLDRRAPVTGVNDEIGRLAHTLNDMLDRLEISNLVQRRFVADASHELRTPVANIRTAVEVASAHPARTDWSAVAADVLTQDARMERLTEDLLLLARSGATSLPVRAVEVNLAEIAAAEVASRAADGRLVLDADARVTVSGDPQHLAKVLSNLVDNGLRHARKKVTITVTSGATWAELKVADDGPGIAISARETVFDPFVRLDEHRDRQGGGTGLGLAIVRQVVVAHHGTVRIGDNEPGAVFVVRLPLSGSSQALGLTVNP